MSADSNNNQGRQTAREADGGNQEYYLSYPLIKKRMKSTPYICIKCDEPFRRASKIYYNKTKYFRIRLYYEVRKRT